MPSKSRSRTSEPRPGYPVSIAWDAMSPATRTTLPTLPAETPWLLHGGAFVFDGLRTKCGTVCGYDETNHPLVAWRTLLGWDRPVPVPANFLFVDMSEASNRDMVCRWVQTTKSDLLYRKACRLRDDAEGLTAFAHGLITGSDSTSTNKQHQREALDGDSDG